MGTGPGAAGSATAAGGVDGVAPVPPTSDPLTEALQFLRLDGIFYCRTELTAPFGAHLPPMAGCLWFHVVTAGACTLVDSGGVPHRLGPGTMAVLPRGAGHDLVDEPSSGGRLPSVLDLPHDHISPQYAILRHGGGGEPASLVCAAVRVANPSARGLLDVLPEVLVVDPATAGRAGAAPTLAALPALLDMVAAETRRPAPGSEAVVTRVCDILAITAIRTWLDTDPSARTGWLGALRDPRIGQAVALIHREPERPWTVAELADAVAMSRSAFAARFREMVGRSPVRYLTGWRMRVATDLLAEEQLTVARVAERLGYASEAAFSRAYRRHTGMAPGEVRRRGRD
jgi:AraC-like DNA-binding protein